MFESIMLYLSFLFKFPFKNDLVWTFPIMFIGFGFSLGLTILAIKGLGYLIFLKASLRKAKNAMANMKVKKSKKGKEVEVKRVNSVFLNWVFKWVKFLSYWSSFFMVLLFISLTGLYFLDATTKIKPFYGFESLVAEGFYFGFLFLINLILLVLMIRHSYLESKTKKRSFLQRLKSVLLTMLVLLVMSFLALFNIV